MSRCHRKYNKNSSCWTVEKVKGGKTHNYILELIERVIMQHETGETLLSKKHYTVTRQSTKYCMSPDNPLTQFSFFQINRLFDVERNLSFHYLHPLNCGSNSKQFDASLNSKNGSISLNLCYGNH